MMCSLCVAFVLSNVLEAFSQYPSKSVHLSPPPTPSVLGRRRLSSNHLTPQHRNLLLPLNTLPRLPIQIHTPTTNIRPKLARRQPRLKHLVNLLERPILDFRQEEEDPRRRNNARREPNESVPRTPVERLDVEEVWCGKGSQPRAYEAGGGCEPESVGAQALGGEFATTEPGVCADHAVVAEHVYAGETDGHFAGRLRIGMLLVYGGDDELEETADDEAGHE
jgi:hypothetical protein